MPVGFLDGGRVVTAPSPWLWLVGLVVVTGMLMTHFSLILLLIVLMSLPRVFSLFRKRTTHEVRYFEVTPRQRWTMGAMYFGLVAMLAVAMQASYVDRRSVVPNDSRPAAVSPSDSNEPSQNAPQEDD